MASLYAAVTTTADGTSTLKHGVKNGLYYLLKNSATIIMASHLGSGDDSKAAEVKKFIHYLDLNRDTIFEDAVYAINKSRQEQIKDAWARGYKPYSTQLSTVSCSSLAFTLCSNSGEVIKHLEHEIVLSVEHEMLKS